MQVSTIAINFSNIFLINIFNTCSDKVPTLVTCLQKVLVGEDDDLAIYKAFTTHFQNEMCVGDISDEQYEKLFKHVLRFTDLTKVFDSIFLQ